MTIYLNKVIGEQAATGWKPRTMIAMCALYPSEISDLRSFAITRAKCRIYLIFSE